MRGPPDPPRYVRSMQVLHIIFVIGFALAPLGFIAALGYARRT